MKKIILLLCFNLFAVLAIAQAPPNDICSGAINLNVNPVGSCSSTYTADHTNATMDSNNGFYCGFGGIGTFYTFTAPNTEGVEINITNGTQTGTAEIGIYESCSANRIFCNDIENNNRVFGLVPGNTYILSVLYDDFFVEGDFTICLSARPAPPVNDDCDNATVLDLGSTTGTTLSATPTSFGIQGGSGTPNNDVWYSFTASEATHTIALTNITVLPDSPFANTSMYMILYERSNSGCQFSTRVASVNGTIRTFNELNIGTEYLIRVYGSSSLLQDLSFTITNTPVDTPSNDDCNFYDEIASGDPPLLGTTLGATQSSQSTAGVSGTPNNDVWYQFIAEQRVHEIVLSNITVLPGSENSNNQLSVAVYEDFNDDCSNLTLVRSLSAVSRLSLLDLQIGETYLVRVYGRSFNYQNIQFSIETNAIPVPSNNDCSSPTSLTVNPEGSCASTSGIGLRSATNSGATFSCMPSNPNNIDLWYDFTAPNTGNISIELTPSTTLQKRVAIFDACNGNEIFCEAPGSNNVTNVIGLTPSQNYLLALVYEDNSASASSRICLSEEPDTLANDTCNTAVELTVNPSNNGSVCTSTTTVNHFAATATNTNFSCDTNTAISNLDSWYTFTAPADTVNVEITNDTQSGTAYLSVFDTCNGTEVFCGSGDTQNTFSITGLVLNSDYTMAIWYKENETEGNFEICLLANFATPPNDEAEGAVPLTVNSYNNCDTTYTATNIGATASSVPSPFCFTSRIDTWYSFVAPTSGAIRFQVTNGTQTTIPRSTIYEDNNGNIGSPTNCLGSNNQVVSGLIPGDTYLIRIGYEETSTLGDFSICLSEILAPPNDDCSNPQLLSVNSEGSCTSTYIVDNTLATDGPGFNCSFSSSQIETWYTFEAPTTGNVKFNITNITQEGDPEIGFINTCGDNTLNCYSNDQTITGLTPGEIYIVTIVFPTGGNQRGTSEICLSEVATTIPMNNECASAQPLTVNGYEDCAFTYIENNLFATNSNPSISCRPDQNNRVDTWYSFVAPNSGQIALDLIALTTPDAGSNFADIAIFDACNGNEVFCQFGSSADILGLTPSATYVMILSQFIGSTLGEFGVCLSDIPLPPANDNCINAIAVNSLPYTYSQNDGFFATSENGAIFSCGNNINDGTWFTYTPTANQNIEIRITGSEAWSPAIAVYTGDCNSLTCEMFQDEYGFNNPNEVLPNVPVLDGVTYYINIGKSGTVTASNPQNFDIEIIEYIPIPNDDCNGAIPLTVNPFNDCSSTYTTNNLYASNSNVPFSCSGFPQEQVLDTWYTFTAPASGQINLEITNINEESLAYVAIYDTCNDSELFCDNLNNLGMSVGTIDITELTPGNTYTMAIWFRDFYRNGDFTICLSDLQPIVTPDNDDCINAEVLIVGASPTTGNNTNATYSGTSSSCDFLGGIPDVWYSFVAPASGSVTISTTVITANLANIAVWEDCSLTTELACSVPFGDVGTSAELTNLTAGNTYYIQVWNTDVILSRNSSRVEGTFTIAVTEATLSIDDETKAPSLNLFPNPVSSELTLKANKIINSVTIYDINGRLINTKNTHEFELTLDVHNLSQGVYFLEIQFDTITQVKRFIKK